MNTALAIILLSYATFGAVFERAHERKVQGRDDLESVTVLAGTPAYEFTRVVARAERAFDEFGFCTASRVGDHLFLTNYHCDQPCAATQFRMGYVEGSSREDQAVWKCKALLHKELEFDYALYEVEPGDAETAQQASQFPILTLWVGPLRDGQLVYAASHPVGKAMQLDRSDACVITDATPFLSTMGRLTVKHGCDTEGSSSGAPLLDRTTGYGVALHWGGRLEFNEAIPMSLVVKSLREHVPAVIGQLDLAGE